LANALDPVSEVGSVKASTDPAAVAEQMRSRLEFQPGQRGSSWGDAFRRLTEATERLGVLVMVNGVVGSNTHRKLDPEEFRGFALVDDLAPLIFVNGADTKAAQIFTLLHELGHICLGQSSLDDLRPEAQAAVGSEQWCNRFAAEVLLPLSAIREEGVSPNQLRDLLDRYAREYRTSTLVVLRRLHEADLLSPQQYWDAFHAERERVLALTEEGQGAGGNFYNTQPVRTSKRFTRALLESTLEGRTLHRDAFRLLGLKNPSTFAELASRLDVA
jgi:Zn-dependent peptidase ImmA (M78 family)